MISTGFYQEEFKPIKFGRTHMYVKQWNGIFIMYITNKCAHIVLRKHRVVNSNIHLPLVSKVSKSYSNTSTNLLDFSFPSLPAFLFALAHIQHALLSQVLTHSYLQQRTASSVTRHLYVLLPGSHQPEFSPNNPTGTLTL